MPTVTADLPKTPADAVTEATRIAVEAARGSAKTAHATLEAARKYWDETAALGRNLAATWSARSDEAIRAAVEARKAAVDTQMGFFDSDVKSSRQSVDRLTDLIHRAQEATLESWQETVKLVAGPARPTKR